MGLFDFIKNEFIEVIEWVDDTRDTLVYKFPDQDKAIKRGAKLIVRDSQVAQFMYQGEPGDLFQKGPHDLVTDNIPILTKLRSWKFGFDSPFKADVWFIVVRTFTGNKWGTPNPIMMRDPDFGMVRVRAFGSYDFKIVDVPRFLKEVVGTHPLFKLEDFDSTMRSRIVSAFSDALGTAKVPVLDLAARYTELGDALLPVINPIIKDKYGLELTSFVVENVSVPPEVEKAIDQRSSMGAIGNLNDFVKFQMANGMAQPGGGGPGGMAAEMAIGMQMANQMFQQNQPQHAPAPAAAPAAAPAPAAAAGPELLGVADVARVLGVSEEDVQAVLASGELKGKKIGATWRITRAAVDDYLKA